MVPSAHRCSVKGLVAGCDLALPRKTWCVVAVTPLICSLKVIDALHDGWNDIPSRDFSVWNRNCRVRSPTVDTVSTLGGVSLSLMGMTFENRIPLSFGAMVTVPVNLMSLLPGCAEKTVNVPPSCPM